MASALLFAAGCAHEDRTVRTETVTPGYGHYYGNPEYNAQNHYSSPTVSSTYSGDHSVTSTPSGAYSSKPRTDSWGYQTAASNQSDNDIVAQVREDLQKDPEIAFIVPNLQITANNGALILSGSVQSEEQKRQILARVQKISGVATVNNQLTVISNPNGQNNLNPTGSSSGMERLYKDSANGQDNSTNNVLNPTSREGGPSQLYREGNQGQEQNGISSGNELNATNSGNDSSSTGGSIDGGSQLDATSRANSASQIYHDGSEVNSNQNTNNLNNLNPTSRENGSSQIYQNNPGEKAQDQNANTNSNQGNQQMP